MLSEYRVFLATKPGMYAQYKSYVVVYAEDIESAAEKAFRKVKREFPDYSRSMWKVVSIEKVGVVCSLK